MTETWSRERVRAVLEQLRQLPDFDAFPLPETIYKEYNIPMPEKKILSVMDYMNKHNKTRDMKVDSFEIKEPDNKIREVPSAPPVELIICPVEETEKVLEDLKAKNENETSEQPHQSQDTPTESNGLTLRV